MSNEVDYLYLTTIGRTTGLPRQIEIWFVEHEGAYYLVSGGREQANWVQNIKANPAIEIRIGTREAPMMSGSGRIIERDAEPELAAAVAAKMDAKYDWSDGLIVELKPDSA